MKFYKYKKMVDDGQFSDVHYTPKDLAHKIVNHYKPTGKVLEPCKGDDAFYSHNAFTDWCEIQQGKDFFDFEETVDWIITNPPYSIFAQFLEHSMEIAQDIVFAPIKLDKFLSSKKRHRMYIHYGFGIKELIRLPEKIERPFPQTGFQYYAIHMSKGYSGPINYIDWNK